MVDTPTEFERGYLRRRPGEGLLRERFFRKVCEFVDRVRPASVLEVGCGAGHSTARLRERLDASVTLEGGDVMAENIARAREVAPGVAFHEESIYELPREDASVDLVACLEVLEHLDEPERALAEIVRVARRHLVISVPREPYFRLMNVARGAYLSGWGNYPGHVNHWDRSGLVRLVDRHADVLDVATRLPWTILLASKREKP